jgi:hypothetical protein
MKGRTSMVSKADSSTSAKSKPALKSVAPVKRATAKSDAEATEANDSETGADFIRRKAFIDRIVASSGMKPNAVKSTLDAVLHEIGDALSKGESLNLPPLGKLSVNRKKDIKNGEVLVCKLRRSRPAEKIQPTLAEVDEER